MGFPNTPNPANILPGSFDVNWDNYYTGQPVFNVKNELSIAREPNYRRTTASRNDWRNIASLTMWIPVKHFLSVLLRALR
jgi:hypothetical protein